MKYFIYCRVSQDREDRQVLSPQSQKKELQAFAQRNGLVVVDTITEKQTAYKTGRPKFNDMLERIENGEAEGLIVYHLSRIARNPVDSGIVIHLMDKGFIKEVRTQTATYNNTSEDKLQMNLLMAFDKKSSDDNSTWVKRDTITKLEKGELPGKAKRGYLNISKEGVIVGKQYDHKKQELLNCLGRPLNRIEKDPLEASLVRKLFEMALTGQYGLNALREKAYELGLASLNNTPLSKSMVRNILSDSYYYGEFEYAGQVWPGSHETIVSKSEFEQVQDIISNRSRPKRYKRQYLLAMVVPCPYCGHLLSGEHQKGHDYLRCTKAKEGKCEFKSNPRQDKLEKQFVDLLKTIQIPENVVEYLLKLVKRSYEEETKSQHKSLASIRKNIGLLEAKKTQLTSKWAVSDAMSDDDYLDMKKALESQINSQNEALVNIEQSQNDWIDRVESFFKLSRKLVSTFERATIEDKRIIMDLVSSKFILTGEQLSVELAEPFKALFEAKHKSKVIRTTQKLDTDYKKPLSEEEMEVWQDTLAFIRIFCNSNDHLMIQ